MRIIHNHPHVVTHKLYKKIAQENLQKGIMFPVMVGQCENASCYGAPTTNPMDRCCYTCKDVKSVYQNMYWNIVPHNIIQCSGKFIYV